MKVLILKTYCDIEIVHANDFLKVLTNTQG